MQLWVWSTFGLELFYAYGKFLISDPIVSGQFLGLNTFMGVVYLQILTTLWVLSSFRSHTLYEFGQLLDWNPSMSLV